MHIYVVHCKHLSCSKVGIATNTKKRLVQIQNGCPYSLDLVACFSVDDQRAALAIEEHAAWSLRPFHMLGEWYAVTPEQAIQAVEQAISMSAHLLTRKEGMRQKWNNVHSRGEKISKPFLGKSPAQVVIERFGGVRNVARAIGYNPSSVTRWQRDSGAIGTGGRIPSSVQQLLLDKAKELGIQLSIDELLHGTSSEA
ncbi:MAG TPA: GIY-YIG nuclease family protein [Pseudoxanthomonas sp.]